MVKPGTGKLRLGFFLFLLLTGSLILFLRQQPEEIVKKRSGFQISITGLKMLHAQAGQKKWELRALKSAYSREKSVIKLVSPKITYFLEGKNDDLFVEAERGWIAQNSTQAELGPEVVARYAQNTLFCDRFHYSAEKKELRFTGRVRFFSKQMQARSKRALYDLKTQRLILKGDVEVFYVRKHG